MARELTARVNDSNPDPTRSCAGWPRPPDPRIACVLLLDTSSSMDGEPIRALNDGFGIFCKELQEDNLARKRAEVAVITFGEIARVEIPFTEGRDLQPRQFNASGLTTMDAAVNLALDEIAAQKQAYKEAGLEYYRPWMWVITDGATTDTKKYQRATDRARIVEKLTGDHRAPTAVSAVLDGARRRGQGARLANSWLQRLSQERAQRSKTPPSSLAARYQTSQQLLG
jgi:Mg-chelatase subunit ChlD